VLSIPSRPVPTNNPLTNLHIVLRPSVTSKEQVNLGLNLPKKEKLSITIIDIMGRVQFHKATQLDKGEHNLTLPVGHLAKGIYYVRVTGTNNINQSLHLVKQ
jgi:hypothetical protein